MTEPFPWNVYPRPQLKRDSFLLLNGEWEFALQSEGASLPDSYSDRIIVPFCPESKLSGLHMPILPRQQMVYHRVFYVDPAFLRDITLLHFGAVDQCCRVLLNGTEIGGHEGGYLPFTMDVSQVIREGENDITVIALDPLDHDLPWGKQKYQRGGMWYTPVSGIWQTVWLESLPDDGIRDLRITPDLSSIVLDVTSSANLIRIQIPEIGYDLSHKPGRISIEIPHPHLWSPEDPHLYDLFLSTETDTVQSYFALRRIDTAIDKDGHSRIRLNGKPIFLHGVLDQGYYHDGIYTPDAPEQYERDIVMLKEMGFNLIRKHIKVEPLWFYHLCDRIGMLVMQDFVNTGEYSFLRDTALPTVGVTRLPDCMLHRTKRAKAFFLQNAEGTQHLLYNSPSVIAYTVFNEGWGQFSADAVYSLLKNNDPSRLYDATSGWFAQKKSDLDSRHVYFRKLRLKAGKRPLFLSEFGGYAWCDKSHAFSEKSYGYRTLSSAEELEESILRLYREQVIPLIERGLCGSVYTQLSDVEDEINGLVTYDRLLEKVEREAMKQLSEEIYDKIKS